MSQLVLQFNLSRQWTLALYHESTQEPYQIFVSPLSVNSPPDYLCLWVLPVSILSIYQSRG